MTVECGLKGIFITMKMKGFFFFWFSTITATTGFHRREVKITLNKVLYQRALGSFRGGEETGKEKGKERGEEA